MGVVGIALTFGVVLVASGSAGGSRSYRIGNARIFALLPQFIWSSCKFRLSVRSSEKLRHEHSGSKRIALPDAPYSDGLCGFR